MRGKVPTTTSIKDLVFRTLEQTPDVIYSSTDVWMEIYHLWGAITAKSSIQRVLTELVNEGKIIKRGTTRPRYHIKSNESDIHIWGLRS